jgi:hypothetical protein
MLDVDAFPSLEGVERARKRVRKFRGQRRGLYRIRSEWVWFLFECPRLGRTRAGFALRETKGEKLYLIACLSIPLVLGFKYIKSKVTTK